jgi:hypothetical protein
VRSHHIDGGESATTHLILLVQIAQDEPFHRQRLAMLRELLQHLVRRLRTVGKKERKKKKTRHRKKFSTYFDSFLVLLELVELGNRLENVVVLLG